MKPYANSPPLRILLRIRDDEKEMFQSAFAGTDDVDVKLEEDEVYGEQEGVIK